MQITPWQWITWKSCMSHSVTSLPKLGGHICVAIQLWWCCNCVTCVLQLVCCNCVTRVLQLVCVAIGMCCVLQLRCGDVVIVWPVCCNWCVAIGMCCNSGVVIVAIELLQMQLRCNCVVIVCSSRCNWELIATAIEQWMFANAFAIHVAIDATGCIAIIWSNFHVCVATL